MAVQYSVQRMVSDGTLSTIALGIQYLQRNDIHMRIAGEETPQVGAPSGYTWSFINNTTLKILPVVPNGVEIAVYRRTGVDAMYNVYSQNAQFDEATIDENNQQLLYIAQEYLEQGIHGAGVDTLEFVRDDGTYTYYRIKRTDGSYSDEFAVPSADISTNVLTRLYVVEDKVATLEQRKSTCLVNATGTGAPHETVVAQLPVNIAVNTRYVLPNPFGINTPVECWAEVFANGKWARTGFVVVPNSGGFGTEASYVQGEGIIVQTGGVGIAASSPSAGGGHGLSSVMTTAPCRVFVRKLEA